MAVKSGDSVDVYWGYLESTLNFGVYQSQSISLSLILFDCLSLSLRVYKWMDV